MEDNPDLDYTISEYKRLWLEYAKNQPLEDNFDKSIIEKSPIGILSRSSQIVVSVFQNKTQKAEYISPNVKEMFGYDETHDSLLGMMMWMKLMVWEHVLYPVYAFRVHQKFMKDIPQNEKTNVKMFYCGLKLKNRWGKILRLFVQTTPLETDEEGEAVRTLSLCHDIAPYLKNNDWWIRYSYGENPTKVKYHHSAGNKSFDHDILSEREIEILKLIADGYESKEIADKLFISVATVNTHRRNMIERMGVIDTTALMHLARLCEMI
jgi:DNA-binding CsgD family transcriptional regulator